jgi:hypothetical protein
LWAERSASKCRGRRQRQHARPSLEFLEDRLAPAVYTVNALTDSGAGSGLAGDLRYCINQVNSNGGDNTITFNLPSGSTITLDSALGTLLFTDTTGTTSVQGPGATALAISGGNAIAIFNVQPGASVVLDGLTLTQGHTLGFGGGIRNLGTLAVSDCAFTNNFAVSGGGVNNDGILTVANTTFSGNVATGGGGLANGATATVINSTFAGNHAAAGGALSTETGPLTLTNCTISGNVVGTLGLGAGLFNVTAGTVTLDNTIVAGNTVGTTTTADDVIGTVDTVHSSNNLIGTGGSGGLSTGVNNNQVGVANPGLAPLGSYGGTTQTVALLPGSPAIDAGNNALVPGGVTTDQRGTGFARIVGGTVDIGAFESEGFTLTSVSGSNQSTAPNTAFATPLVVLVTANNPLEPVAGGVVTYTGPGSGADIVADPSTATIAANGQASLTATANGVVGFYSVTASTTGAAGTASFALDNGSATQLAASLIAYIENLIDTDVIDNGTGTSLINADLKQITDTSGINQIDDFIAQVQKDAEQGKIPQANADYMIAQAELIESLLSS